MGILYYIDNFSRLHQSKASVSNEAMLVATIY